MYWFRDKLYWEDKYGYGQKFVYVYGEKFLVIV